jgi:hypothetical protein
MADEPAKTAVFRPPRALRGRRERMLWRSIAPLAAANGRLTPATEPLLMVFVRALAQVYETPDYMLRSDRISDGDLKRMRDLAKSFGILQ